MTLTNSSAVFSAEKIYRMAIFAFYKMRNYAMLRMSISEHAEFVEPVFSGSSISLFFLFTIIKKNQKKFKFLLVFLCLLVYDLWCILTKEDKMRMRKYENRSVSLIGLRANDEEQKMFQLIMNARKIPSRSHVIRVLVTEEAEKILASQSPDGVNEAGK